MFGKNPIRPPEKGDGSILFVQEIFPTLQGEGPLAGVPAVFLRLGGCNLACSFCDTEFESFKEWKLEDIIAEVKKLSLPPLPLRERAGVRGYTENTLDNYPNSNSAGSNQSDPSSSISFVPKRI